MLKRGLSWLAILWCLQATDLVAQNRTKFGPLLLPAANATQPVPGIEKYALDKGAPALSGQARLPWALGRVSEPEPALRLRGAREIELYRTLAPSVALIVSDIGQGSASLIATKTLAADKRSGVLLTSAHVLGDAREVAVIFKPQKDGEKITEAHAVRGRVRKLDPVRDLALIEVESVPAYVAPIPLGSMSEAQVGADVHAIGHPEGQTWTYTKGLISQLRPDYEWRHHKVDVIQTQTPINPGNSGGPLISDGGKLIGVNFFKQPGEGLNFAVAISDIERFLKAAQDGAYEPPSAVAAAAASPARPCEPKVMYEGRTKENTAFVRTLDMDCSGKANAVLIIPDDTSQPVEFRMDTNTDGKTDAWIFDDDRDGKWDASYWDADFDGKPDLVGHHPDGVLKPARIEKYQPKS
jgi:S1-C subfamily serine protease